jgi:hypothetical protein
MMTDQIKRFELLILRPLQIALLLSALVTIIRAQWLWLGCSLLGLFYLGIVGSKLHPLQSASELAEGPVEGRAARIESTLLPPGLKQMLVGHACTRVGILIGLAAGVVLWGALGWRWYFALLVAWFILMFVGATLKVVFGTTTFEA